MASVLGLLAALGYGLGDFVAGMLSRRVHFAVVAVLASLASLAVMTPVVVIAGSPPTALGLAWGALSGVGTAVGSLALFRGLARGRMGVVAPLSALTAAAIPVVVGVLLGDRPALVAWAGVVLAVPAIWLVSSADDPGPAIEGDRGGPPAPCGPSGVADGLLAGAGFALLFLGLALAGEDAGLWPVLANEAAALVLLAVGLVAVLPAADRRRPAAHDLAIAALVGCLGAVSTVAYFLATNAGLLSIVVVLTSLYPAVTVVLAVVVTHEKIGRRQAIGLGLACAAIALIVLGQARF